jgi:DNA-binding transcriptional MerR regulator
VGVMEQVVESFRGPQVCSIVGITYRQLDYWTRTDLIKASVADAKGSGTQRLYSYGDLLEIKVIKSLLDSGFDLKKVRTMIGYLRDNLGEDVAAANLVITGGNSVLTQSGEELVDVMRNGQGVLNIVPIGGLQTELLAKITELHPSEPAADVDDDDGRLRAAR